MSLLQINYKQIRGAIPSVYDFLSAAQITAVKTDNYTVVTSAQITSALTSAITAAGSGALHIPAGTYRINAPLTFSCSMSGDGAYVSNIMADTTFTGDWLLNFDNAVPNKFIIDISWDAGAKDIQVFGSTNYNGSSVGRYSNLVLSSTSLTKYMVGGTGTGAGMLTGSTWTNCSFAAPLCWNGGSDQDDYTLISCRFNDGGKGLSNVIRTAGQNVKFISTYLSISRNAANTGVNFGVIQAAGAVEYDGLFVETYAGTYGQGTDNNWLFDAADFLTKLVVNRLTLNVIYTGGAANAAIIRKSLPNAAVLYNRTQVSNVGRSNSGGTAWTYLFNVFNGNNVASTTPLGPLYLDITNCDEFTTAELMYQSSGFANSVFPVQLTGSHNGSSISLYAVFTGGVDVVSTLSPRDMSVAALSASSINSNSGTQTNVVTNTWRTIFTATGPAMYLLFAYIPSDAGTTLQGYAIIVTNDTPQTLVASYVGGGAFDFRTTSATDGIIQVKHTAGSNQTVNWSYTKLV